jgi:hypothetical protein
MQVGSLVRETIDGCVGIIMEWSNAGWLVHFPEHDCVFHMKPSLLEMVL